MSTGAAPQPDRQYLLIPPEGEGQRLDRWLSSVLPDHSRSEIQRWIREGAVEVDGSQERASHRLSAGEQVFLSVPQSTPATTLTAEPIPVPVLYEDEDVLVVDKPAGMVVHPAPGHEAGTLVNAILHLCPDLPGVGGEHRPGIVHRLDKDTSGVMIVAKHDRALRHLQAQFKARQVYKEYLALVEGKLAPSAGRIVAPIGRHPADRKRQAVRTLGSDAASPRTREAVTDYRVESVFTVPLRTAQGTGSFSLVTAHPLTGRTHQIRVHLAWRGHPIVGDPVYGLRHPRLRVPRLCLHAARLRIRLLQDDEPQEFVALLPEDIRSVLGALRAATPMTT